MLGGAFRDTELAVPGLALVEHFALECDDRRAAVGRQEIVVKSADDFLDPAPEHRV